MHVLPCMSHLAVFTLRYGKFVVLDLLDIEEAWAAIQTKFDVVKKNLLSDLMSKELMKGEK